MLKEIRLRKNMTLEQAGKVLKLKPWIYWKLEQGKYDEKRTKRYAKRLDKVKALPPKHEQDDFWQQAKAYNTKHGYHFEDDSLMALLAVIRGADISNLKAKGY